MRARENPPPMGAHPRVRNGVSNRTIRVRSRTSHRQGSERSKAASALSWIFVGNDLAPDFGIFDRADQSVAGRTVPVPRIEVQQRPRWQPARPALGREDGLVRKIADVASAEVRKRNGSRGNAKNLGERLIAENAHP